jgi:dihydroneopterin aldolase
MLPAVDRIEIRGLRALGHHGVHESEQADGQIFVVDVTLELDLARAARSDNLAHTVDYSVLVRTLADAVSQTRFDLIEALGGHLAGLVLADQLVDAVTVRVSKPDAPVAANLDEVAISLRRERD